MKVKLSKPWRFYPGGPRVYYVVTRDFGIRIGFVRQEGAEPWTAHMENNGRDQRADGFRTAKEAAAWVLEQAKQEIAAAVAP